MWHYIWFVFIFITQSVFLSCNSRPAVITSQDGIVERVEIPAIPKYILGKGLTRSENLTLFLLYSNPEINASFVKSLALIYVEEAAIEGVNHDVAFAQMCLETGFLRYGNLVTPDMNNFCGLGSTGPEHPGERFPDARTGVRAQIQHLKGYATDAPLKQALVDPRYWFVRLGAAPAITGLTGTWAMDPAYSDKINDILERLYTFSFENEPAEVWQ